MKANYESLLWPASHLRRRNYQWKPSYRQRVRGRGCLTSTAVIVGCRGQQHQILIGQVIAKGWGSCSWRSGQGGLEKDCLWTQPDMIERFCFIKLLALYKQLNGLSASTEATVWTYSRIKLSSRIVNLRRRCWHAIQEDNLAKALMNGLPGM